MAARPPTRILVAEDDPDIGSLLEHYLKKAGFLATLVASGREVMPQVKRDSPDLVVLDLMLPGLDGLQLCRAIRADANTAAIPIIMLTAKAEESDRIIGLELGADDYITKPFSLREVEARIKSVLRRARAGVTTEGADETPIVRGNLRVDPVRREVTIADRHVDLTPKEFDLLRLFASNPGRVFPRKYLLEKIWDYSYEGYDRTIDSHINRLRAKIEDNPENPQLVLTVWGIGYKFSDVE